MKDPSQKIVDAYYSLLNGKVTYSGKKVKVFKRPPKDTEIPIIKGAMYHYIEIGDVTDSETGSNADVFSHDATCEIYVVVGFPGIGDKSVMNNIVNQVLNKTLTGKGAKLSLGSDFTNIVHVLETAFDTQEQDMHKKLIKNLRYRLEIDETS